MTSTRTDPLALTAAHPGLKAPTAHPGLKAPTAHPGLKAPLLRRASAAAIAIALACAAGPRPASAAQANAPATTSPAEAKAPSDAEPPETAVEPNDAKPATDAEPPKASANAKPTTEAKPTIDGALADGDLTTALSLAKAAREADPSPGHWHREAEILEVSGQYTAAAKAYQAEIDALPEDAKAARAAAAEDLERVRIKARAVVADEPASTHRTELDASWTPEPKVVPKPRIAANPPVEPTDRIVTKWYFWVTIGAIVASAAAVTGIAIRASREQRSDSLDALERSPTPIGPAILRF